MRIFRQLLDAGGLEVHNVELQLNLSEKVRGARTVIHETELIIENGKLVVPQIDGYEIVVLEYEG